jgi:sensor histidine kinase YesM
LLQPLVENAIRHGIEADTGVGLNPNAPEGVGLSNVRARLSSLYGPSAKLLLYANAPRGVVAKLIVPGAV